MMPWGDQTQLSSRCWALAVLPVDAVGEPFDPREVDAPLSPGCGGRLRPAYSAETLPGDRDFERPAAVVVAGSLSVPSTWTAVFQPGNLPAVVGRAAVLVGLRQEQVPVGVERVDLEFEVFVVVAVGVDEDFEIVVVEDDRVVLGERAPDVRLFQFGGDVEVLVVPEHLGAGAKAGLGFASPFDVGEIVSVQRTACQAASSSCHRRDYGCRSAAADIALRRNAAHFGPFLDRPAASCPATPQDRPVRGQMKHRGLVFMEGAGLTVR